MNNYIDNALLYNYDILPPEDVVSSVNPFSKPFKLIIAGLALWIIKLNFLYLNYLLPFVGILLVTLGFRALKKENRCFLSCFIISVFLLFEYSATLVINTTIFHQAIYQLPIMKILTFISTALSFLLFICLGSGIKILRQKANLTQKTGGTTALIIWYAVLYVLALIGYSGIFIGIIMLVAFAGILFSLYGISKELGEAGYAIEPAAFTIPAWIICSFICLTIIIGSICGYALFGKYKMAWQPLDESEQDYTKTQLSSLGFPEDILKDLSASDLAACSNALEVKVTASLHPANEGREVTEKRTDASGKNIIAHYTVYDQKELLLTSVAVKLPTEKPSWKIFHHFAWEIKPTFYGTECFRVSPAYRANGGMGWRSAGDLSGRILYDENGTTYTAPYESLGTYTHTSEDMIFGQSTSNDIYATFSMPCSGTNHRGYVCYTISENQSGWIIDSWINYTHQKNMLQYPNKTAKDDTLAGFLNRSDAFICVQDAIQFYPE